MLQAKDLRRYYGLDFVTSSMMFEQDSTEVSMATAAEQKPEKFQQKRLPTPSVAYEIAVSAASYVQSRAKDLLSHDVLLSNSNCQAHKEESSLQRMHKSEMAAYVAASAVTAVVAAGEKTKEEAARELQSPQSSPCEWFVCDDSSTHTRCFIIQVCT